MIRFRTRGNETLALLGYPEAYQAQVARAWGGLLWCDDSVRRGNHGCLVRLDIAQDGCARCTVGLDNDIELLLVSLWINMARTGEQWER